MTGTGVDVVSPNHPDWLDGEPQEPDSKTYALSGKIMLTSIVVLFAVVLFLVLLHLYARWYLLRVRHRSHTRRRNRPTHLVFYVDTNGGLASPSGGLDSPVLKSLPVFIFSPETHRGLPECAVCLSEFEEGEVGRSLPKCRHSFHTECIDMWFHTHSTCPLCRAPVEPVEPDFVIDVAQTEPGSGHDGERIGTTSLADRRKGLDNVSINIPSRNELLTQDEFRLPSPASHGFRSPGSRLLSLKRILSMSTKSPAVSPSSGVGTSCLPAHTESDVESTPGPTRPTSPR